MARILAIHAHPDDVEILAGGTLALLAAAGHSIDIVTMSAGDCGSAERTAEEIARVRRGEAAKSAAVIGAKYRWAGFSDLSIFNDDVSRRRVTEVLRVTRPDVVITASPVDYMADHETTSALVRDACFGAPIALYRTVVGKGAAPLPGIPHLYYMSPLDGEVPPPDFCVDVAGVFATKREMLAQHVSQREWLKKQHGIEDYLEQMERWTAACGAHWGIALGEAFRQYRGHAYPQSPMLQELLGSVVTLRQ